MVFSARLVLLLLIVSMAWKNAASTCRNTGGPLRLVNEAGGAINGMISVSNSPKFHG